MALVKFAKKCGVEARNLGQENIRNALRSGFDLVLRTKVSDLKLYQNDIRVIWTQIKDSGDVPLDLRRGYLQFHIKRPLLPAGKKSQKSTRAAEALREVVEAFGGDGVEREAGKIISLYAGKDERIHLEGLRLAAWCADQGINVHDDAFLVMLRLGEVYKDTGLDPLPKLQTILGRIESSPTGHEFLWSVFTRLQRRQRPPGVKVVDAMARADNVTVPNLIRPTLEQLAADDPDLSIALDSLTILLRKRGEVGAVVTRILNRLDRHTPQDIIIRLTRLLLEYDALPQLRAAHFSAILPLLISTLPSEEEYILCRKLYPVARTREFRWSIPHRSHWHQLFHHAVHRTRRHLHFASRLYADLQADGLSIHQTDLLALIRSIGMSRSSSRSILLERHIRDFIDTNTESSPSPMSPDAFVLALVQGLTSSKDAKDTSLGFDLSRRILQDRPIPKSAADLMIPRLAMSSNLYHLRQAVDLLDYSATAGSYNHVIFSIVSHSKIDPRAGQMSRSEALSQAVNVYKRMVSHGISATPRTVSLLLRGLIDAGHTDSAVNVFDAAVTNGLRLKPNAVGRLMGRLVLDGRLDEADQIEAKWRSISPTTVGQGRTYDQAIVGARVLLDVKRGIDVDFDKIAKTTGWTGTIPFLRFVESLKPKPIANAASDSVAEVQNSHPERNSDVGADTENETQLPRPAAMDPDRPLGPWIRSDYERTRGFDRDSTVAVRFRSGIMT